MLNKLEDLKILMWDMETLPFLSFHWGMWKQNIFAGQIVKDVSIICISYKWLGDDEVHCISIGDNPGLYADDPYKGGAEVAAKFIDILNSADFCVAHNGDKFDYRILKAQSVMHDLPPFRVRKVDTLKMAKTAGMFPEGNKLDNIAKVLGIEQKYSTNFGMWKDIALNSDLEQLEKMERYCDQDVRVLEKVFLKLWPHSESILPHVGVLLGVEKAHTCCDRCGSDYYVKHGFYIKNVLKYQRYRCKSCGATFLGRQSIKDGE